MLLGSLIVALFGGSPFFIDWKERVQDKSHEKADRILETTFVMKDALNTEVLALRDLVLLDRYREDWIRYEEARAKFLNHLEILEDLDVQSDALDLLRRRHKNLYRLANSLEDVAKSDEPPSFARVQQDLRAINSFSQDIQAYVDLLLDHVEAADRQIRDELEVFRNRMTQIQYCIIGAILLAFAAQFFGILLPVVRSIKKLQNGTNSIAEGNLNQHLDIRTHDEIEILARTFNQMAATLSKSYQNLEQKVSELEVAKEEADVANRSKSDFLASMSHELRTPLNGILGYAQILKRSGNLNPEQEKGINIVRQCSTHLLTMINDILDLAKIEAGKMSLLPTEFHFPAFLTGVSEICQIKAQQKRLAFNYQLTTQIPEAICADEKRLRQVLINLLGNAVKYTKRGSITFRVGVIDRVRGRDTEPDAVKVRFEIEDTGIGMSAEHLEKIFQPFEQVEEASRTVEGTGLGLSIVQKIIAQMGSQIHVKSVLGQGSLFWFDLVLPISRDWTTAIATRYDKIANYQGSRRKILLVDDRWENRLVVADLLKPLGFEIVEAEDGQAGIDRAIAEKPDLIVTDLVMPELDGCQMMKHLRGMPDFKQTPIIVSSASVFETDRCCGLDAGGDDFLPKPVQMEELLDLLQLHLQLDWVYAEMPRSEISQSQEFDETSKAIEEENLIAPPPEVLEALLHLSMRGHLKGIRKQAKQLESIDEKYVPFAKKLDRLAQNFQEREILELLKSLDREKPISSTLD